MDVVVTFRSQKRHNVVLWYSGRRSSDAQRVQDNMERSPRISAIGPSESQTPSVGGVHARVPPLPARLRQPVSVAPPRERRRRAHFVDAQGVCRAALSRRARRTSGDAGSIAPVVSTMAGFEVPAAAWHVHATAAALYERMGNTTAQAQHRRLSRSTILKLAHSLPAEEPLRTTFLSAPRVRVVLGDTELILGSAAGP